MSANYSHGLTYQCMDVNRRSGACGRTVVSVVARSRHFRQIALDDVIQRVGDLCVRPSDFSVDSHEGLFRSQLLLIS